MDSTGVESNIHYPTDGELLWDCIRVINRIIQHVKEEYPDLPFEYHDHTRRSKKRRFKIINTNSKEHRMKAYKDLLSMGHLTFTYAAGCLESLKLEEKKGDIEAGVYRMELTDYKESLELIIAQTERRVLNGDKVSSEDKLVSIFEKHTDILAKGKRKVVFGHKILLTGGKSNLILDCLIEKGNWSDAQHFKQGLDRCEEKYDVIPKNLTTDGGFASLENYDYAVDKGVEKVVFTKKCSVKISELIRTSQAYKKLKKFRAGIEGCISAAKRSYGLDRCTWKGWRGFQSYVWLSVIAFNLQILVDKLL